MTKIERVLRDIQDLRDFYKKTKPLRTRIKKKGLGPKKSLGINRLSSYSRNQ